MMLKKVAAIVIVVSAIAATLLVIDVLGDRKYKVAVEGPSPLYALPPYEYPKSNPVLFTLPVGAPLRVLRVRYGKDFQALRVETLEGQAGWVVNGDGVKVLSRGTVDGA